MKSNQERSNECLPPKKRELPASTLASDDRPLATPPATPPASDAQRGENLAWLASVTGPPEGRRRTPESNNGPLYKPLSMSDSCYSSSSSYAPLPPPSSSSSSSSSSLRLVSSLPAVYASPGVAPGSLHYAPLAHGLQFIASPYSSPYASYVPSQLLPPPPPPPPVSSSSPSPSPAAQHRDPQASRLAELQRASAAACTAMPPPSADYHPAHSSSLRTLPQSPSHHHHAHLPPPPAPHPHPHHPHHKLGHAISQLVLQYADPPSRREEGGVPARGSRELHNGGEHERGRRSGAGAGSAAARPAHKARGTPPRTSSSPSSSSAPSSASSSPYEAHQLVLPADYTTHDAARPSFMLMANSHPDHGPPERGGIMTGKPVHRSAPPSSSSSGTSTFTFPPPLGVDALKASVSSLSPHTVIQTTHGAAELLALGLPPHTAAGSLYPQAPIIGYIGGHHHQHQQQQQQQQHQHHHHQQPISYHHASLQQHLLIPGSQPVIVPVSGGGVATMESAASHASSAAAAAASASLAFPGMLPPQTYLAAPKREAPDGPLYHPAHLLPPPPPPPPPVAATTSSASRASPAPSGGAMAAAPPALPPYFARGSIIQLADGELKRVEELKTEDFIQSAEISGELKIDSSTVERIDESPASRHLAVVQFSVGEHRAQVSVEVLAEYPFFVFGQGWSSCCPDRTTQTLELPCARLSVGDVCISLTLKNLRNGALKKNQPLELSSSTSTSSSNTTAAAASSHGHLKPPRSALDAPARGGGAGSKRGERENGVRPPPGPGGGLGGGAAVKTENGTEPRPGGGPRGRKRRWSAPEGRKVERAEAELPAALPRPSFLPHDVKVRIEGHSSLGK